MVQKGEDRAHRRRRLWVYSTFSPAESVDSAKLTSTLPPPNTLSQLLDLVFDLVQRHRPPWLRKPAVVDLLLLAYSPHLLRGVPRIIHAGYVVLPAVVGERRFELV